MENVIAIKNDAAKHIQAYIEYKNIVGDADGGKLMTPEEYEAYKKKLRENLKNKVYLSWRNIKGVDCKTIGPATKCFCDHRLSEHNFMNPPSKSKVHCQHKGCICPNFDYAPVYGSQDFKCLCKHSYRDHDIISKKCKNPKCKNCLKFGSAWSCSCNYQYKDHVTIVEGREERIKAGRAIDDFDRIQGDFYYPPAPSQQVHGGLNSFMSLVDKSETFGAQIEEMNKERDIMKQKALTGNTTAQKALEANSKGSKQLKTMNKNITTEKKLNNFEINDYHEDEFEENQRAVIPKKNTFPRNQISALELFKTPHTLRKAKLKLKQN